VLNAGDAVFIEAGTVHASFNRSREPAVFLAALGPCGACIGEQGEQGYSVVEVGDEEPWKSLRNY